MRQHEQIPKTRGRHLNHVASLYDPLVEKMSFGRERRFREKTLAIMDINPHDKVLDIGCGTGSLTILIDKHLSGEGQVIGIDAAPKMIKIAQKKAARDGSNATFAVGIAEKLNLEDSSFDIVVNSMFTHHIDNELKRLAFAEMFRILKPGGRLCTADIDKPSTFLAALLGWTSRYLLFQPELEDNLNGKLPELIQEANFKDVNKREHLYGMVSFYIARKPAV
jgi:ubiquinone/menaquinone biosynthesis C-methylase UbiE